MTVIGRLRGETGASAVELALTLGVLLLVLFGITQFGLAYHAYEGAQAAAREGARVASLPQTTAADVTERVREALPLLGASEACPPGVGQYCIEITPAVARPCNLRTGQTVTVAVSKRIRIAIPLWASPEITVVGRGTFRCE